ncbi:hypothetical protein I7I51_04283, partial [Histoplasma capsulatum]
MASPPPPPCSKDDCDGQAAVTAIHESFVVAFSIQPKKRAWCAVQSQKPPGKTGERGNNQFSVDQARGAKNPGIVKISKSKSKSALLQRGGFRRDNNNNNKVRHNTHCTMFNGEREEYITKELYIQQPRQRGHAAYILVPPTFIPYVI